MRKLLFFLGALLLTATLYAQEELHIKSVHAPKTVSFAQPFTLRYQLDYPSGYQVTVDEKSIPSAFALDHVVDTKDPQENQVYELTLFPFALGKSTFTVSFQLQQNHKTVSTQETAPLYIEITPVKIFQDKKLREIRAPFAVHNWLMWLLVLLTAILLICTLYWWKKHIQKTDVLLLSQVEDKRPSHVIALTKIDALLQSGLWENRQYKVFYITLVEILREYLQRRFGLDVSAETSAELLSHIKTSQELSPFMAPLRELLTASDLIKFAKAIPNEAQRNGHILILRTFVKQTIPHETDASKEPK